MQKTRTVAAESFTEETSMVAVAVSIQAMPAIP